MAHTRPTRDETRRKVLDAAFAVFGERGIAATSLEQVAATAGLTKGAVYSNFGSKDDLVLALMEEQISDRIVDRLSRVDQAVRPAEVAERIGSVMVQEICSNGGWHRLLAEYAAIARHDDRVRGELQSRRRQVRALLTQLLDRLAISFDADLPMPAQDLAVVVLALSNGLALEADIEPDGVKDSLFAQALNTMALDAIIELTPVDLPEVALERGNPAILQTDEDRVPR